MAVANSRRFADKKVPSTKWRNLDSTSPEELKKPINPNDWKKLDSMLPEGLHPNFYKMKANQKRFQVRNQ